MLLLMMWLALPAQTQARLSDDQIDQVIAYARTSEGVGGVRCHATAHPSEGGSAAGGFAVMLTGPAGRIFDAVRAAEARGLAFSRDQVTPDMAATTLTVVAYPDTPKTAATGIVIRAGGSRRIVIKPRTTGTVPPISQRAGASEGLRAVFAYQDFAAIHLGDFEVVVLAGTTERVCTIDAATRESIR